MPMPTWALRAREQPARLSSFTLCRPAAYPRAKSSIVPFIFKEMAPVRPNVSHRIHHRNTTLNAARPRPMSCLVHKGHTKIFQTDGAAKNAPGDGAPSMATHAFQHYHTMLNLWSHSSCAGVGALCVWELTCELICVVCLMLPCMDSQF